MAFLLSMLAVGACLAALAIVWSFVPRDVWSIGLYAGPDPARLRPRSGVRNRPVITAAAITDVPAAFVADPFMVRVDAEWHMFFEVLNRRTNRGEIGHATSTDGAAWKYHGIVLAEPFHLSYPYVFRADDAYYMVPETQQAGGVALYRAEAFPGKWCKVADILRGEYRDSSLIQRDGRWWLFALKGRTSLSLHYAESLTGPWVEHPCSPIVHGNVNVTRPGGRIIECDGRLLRFAQDAEPTYGSAVRAFEIDVLTTHEYHERETDRTPVLARGKELWNSHGMHHIDAHPLADGTWIACVDGKRIVRVFRWRTGVRRVITLLRHWRWRAPAPATTSLH